MNLQNGLYMCFRPFDVETAMCQTHNIFFLCSEMQHDFCATGMHSGVDGLYSWVLQTTEWICYRCAFSVALCIYFSLQINRSQDYEDISMVC
jgi:hypothetical protein